MDKVSIIEKSQVYLRASPKAFTQGGRFICGRWHDYYYLFIFAYLLHLRGYDKQNASSGQRGEKLYFKLNLLVFFAVWFGLWI